jgi:hypothetical protein
MRVSFSVPAIARDNAPLDRGCASGGRWLGR